MSEILMDPDDLMGQADAFMSLADSFYTQLQDLKTKMEEIHGALLGTASDTFYEKYLELHNDIFENYKPKIYSVAEGLKNAAENNQHLDGSLAEDLSLAITIE